MKCGTATKQILNIISTLSMVRLGKVISNLMIDLIVSFVVGRNGIAREEAEAWAAELRQSGARGEYFFSLNRYLFLATRARA